MIFIHLFSFPSVQRCILGEVLLKVYSTGTMYCTKSREKGVVDRVESG